jgi:hypothetical protein
MVKVFSAVLALALAGITAAGALAAPAHQSAVCAADYSVQADDWLSKLAEKNFGDPLAYPAIVDATAAAAQTDTSYAAITDPNFIEIGWKLCIPETAEGAMMADGMMAEDKAMMAEGEAMMAEKKGFTVRVENVGEAGTGSPLAPGVWVIHTSADPLFTAGQPDRGLGLEALAEDGNPALLAQAVPGAGVFNTPAGAGEPGPLLPGSAYEFTLEAAPGDHLSFATMLVQSNDLFYAPDGQGIALFGADGMPVSGDITAQIGLWDAGTEVNQEPGVGADQAPRQAGPNTGAAEAGPVQPVADSFTYPAVAGAIRVVITAQ